MAKKGRSRSGKSKSTAQTATASNPSSAVQRRQAVRAARERKRKLRTYALIAVGVLIIGYFAFFIGRRAFNQPGDRVFAQGNAHVTEDQIAAFDYSSRPATSGPHLGSLLPWGIYTSPVSEGRQIHNLEDGGVGIWYNCPEGCPELVAQLEDVVKKAGEDGLIMAPYPDMETRIALTAWNRIDRFEEFDEERITDFINAYRGIDHHAR